MITTLAFLLFLSSGCVRGASTRENMTEGILISGGYLAEYTAEVYVPSTGLSCSLPDLPNKRKYHTMDGLLICGGQYEGTTCLSFISGEWITSHNLLESRYFHTSWQTEHGLVLMGGSSSRSTTEIVSMNGEQGEPSFEMEDETRMACSMPDLTSDSVIITGGFVGISRTVTRYDALGWVEDLPDLLVGRYYHACGSFFRGDGTQVFMVAGGYDDRERMLDSTEVLTMGSGWTLSTPLPRKNGGMMGVTLGGRLYISGGFDNHVTRQEIIGWLEDEQDWEEIGNMKVGRSRHGVTTIQMDDQAMEHCV